MIPTLCFAVGVCLTVVIDARLLLALRRENERLRQIVESLRTRVHSEYWRGVGDALKRRDEKADERMEAIMARLAHPLGDRMTVIHASCDEDAITLLLRSCARRSPHSEGSR